MALFPRLNAGGLAAYDWGSNVVRLSALATTSVREIPSVMAAIMQKVAVWGTDARFRAWLAIQHEAVHYLQDLMTGVGAWDYLARRELLPDLISAARQVSWFPGTSVHRADAHAAVAGFLDQLRRKVVVLPNGELPGPRVERLRAALVPKPGTPGRRVVDPAPFLVESVLEAEAALLTLKALRGLRCSDDDWAIAQDNMSLWNPFAMPDPYNALALEFFAVVKNWAGRAIEHAHITVMVSLALALIDLACAHPSPRLLAASGVPAEEHEPGLKVMRFLRAMQRMPDAEFGVVLEAAVRGDPARIEERVLNYCDVAYPASAEVYADWIDLLDALARDHEDRLAELRAQALRRRLAQPELALSKMITSYIDAQVTFFLITPDGIQSFGTSPNYMDRDWLFDVWDEVAAANAEARVIGHYGAGEPFFCPFSEARTCPAAASVCRNAPSLDRLPVADACKIRKGYEGVAGFTF